MAVRDTSEQPISRPRRRNVLSHQAILNATGQLLTEVGYGLTIEGVAARAGVGKATVYRWWPGKGALVIEAMSGALQRVPLEAATGDLRADLLSAVRRAIEIFASGPESAVIPALAADLMGDPVLAQQFRDQLLRPRRSVVASIVRDAVERGELPPELDIELLLDLYAGAVFYRVVVSGEPVTDALAEQLVGLLLDGKPPLKTAPKGEASTSS
jgi:AcrR family transcriptional regulator